MAGVVQFHYSGQIRRFVIQFIRMISNYQVEFGQDSAGHRTLQTVPVYYGDPSRQASIILKNNSENTLNSVPAMAAYISGLTYDRDRLLNPYFEGQMQVREQAYDNNAQAYTGMQGNRYTVSRLMPAPYKLSIKLDIWTSNTDQKHQLIEQMVPLYNPGFEIQSTDNYVDWSSLSVALLTNVTYTSRTVPAGADDSTIDVATLDFELPIWISLPAKVQKGGVVQQIIANIYDDSGSFSGDIIDIARTSQLRYTPMNYSIAYTGNTLTLYSAVSDDGATGNTVPWAGLVELYGTLVNGISQVRLMFEFPDGAHEVVGTVAYNPSNATQLLFTPDPQTLPANTLSAVTAIIDPYKVNVDSDVLNPPVGTRYLILNPIGSFNALGGTAWDGGPGVDLVAEANDIIEFDGAYWNIAFESAKFTQVQYVTNLTTVTQYCWTGTEWVKSVDGVYRGGDWSLVI
jgi:T4-like virus Myoviridae tail sheath stabiliser